MEPHVFCGPEFVLEVPSHSLQNVLQRVESAPAPSTTSADVTPAETDSVAGSSGQPSATGWTVQPASLLRIQSEIYGICTAEARRQIHFQLALKGCVAQDVRSAMAMVSRRMANFRRLQLPAGYADGGSGGGSVPPPPSSVAFVEARPTHSLSSEEVSSLAQSVRLATPPTPSSSAAAAAASTAPTYLLLYVTDSRAAAQLHLLCLRNTFLALPAGCRLLNYFVFGGRAAAIVPSQVLQKREVLRSHWNFDAELWGVLEAKLTAEFVEEVRRAGAAHNPQYATGRLLTAFEQHEQDVGAVLHYCEQSVRYAGVCDDDEEASPFLLAMGLCMKLGLTMDDVCRHFARHPRRVIRAIALYLARYTLAPEDYVYFFLPSLTDEVIIACTEDAQVTSSMKELSRQLLTKNDVVDAWLPMLAKYWQDHVVTPAMSFMETCWRLQATQGATTDTAAASATTLFADAEASTKASVEEGEYVGGTGRGVAAAFGFRSVAEIAEHAVQHARVLMPQSMATILKRRRGIEDEVFGGAARAGEGEDVADVLDDAEDDDDFLIHVDVVDADDEGGGEGGSGDVPSARRARADVRGNYAAGSAAASASRGGAVTDPHRRIMQAGLKLTLSLLGRRKLLRENVEHYIEF